MAWLASFEVSGLPFKPQTLWLASKTRCMVVYVARFFYNDCFAQHMVGFVPSSTFSVEFRFRMYEDIMYSFEVIITV